MAKKILTVDDARTVRHLLDMTLKEAGYEVIQAEDGLDGVEKLKKTKVDMIISDLNMPRLDGIGFIRQVRAMAGFKFIPIIMLTTESDVNKKQESKSAGASGWIKKPFKTEELLAVVRKVLK